MALNLAQRPLWHAGTHESDPPTTWNRDEATRSTKRNTGARAFLATSGRAAGWPRLQRQAGFQPGEHRTGKP